MGWVGGLVVGWMIAWLARRVAVWRVDGRIGWLMASSRRAAHTRELFGIARLCLHFLGAGTVLVNVWHNAAAGQGRAGQGSEG